jgi:NAD(P)-dependent dehydrogenase (short-subunit alcohol dehydrogenase family)
MTSKLEDLFSLRGKVALVTGGAQGLGRMIAEGLLAAGAKVYITSRKPEIVAAAAAEMASLGECIGIPSDLSTPEAATALAADIAARESSLAILVNNAGKTWGGKLEAFPDRAWPSIMAVNVQAPFTLARDLLPLLKAAATPDDPARIINIGSVAGMAVAHLSAYSYAASKAAIHHLSREMAADLAQYSITVNALAPGFFPTQMTAHIRSDEDKLDELEHKIPLARLGRASDIAGACIYLASRAGAYVTGTVLAVDGGVAGG